MAKFLEMDRSSLEEFAEDLESIQDEMTSMINHGTISHVEKTILKRLRYKLATYTTPICCLCGESPARYTNDAYYCERCVVKE